MGSNSSERIAIIGAGLGGALLAVYLARRGFEVNIYERRHDPRIAGFIGGRSINLALSERGLHALREVGLADEVLKTVIPMPGRMIHSFDGSLHFQAYSKDPQDRINSVSRAELNLSLLNAAARLPNVKMFFDHRCEAIDFDKGCMTFAIGDGRQHQSAQADRIIGADGAFSAVRLQMMLRMDRLDYDQSYLEHGYKELAIPPASDCGIDPAQFNGFAMNPNALHIWPRGGYMMIALPNMDKSFTCTCFWPFKESNGFEQLQSDKQIREYFQRQFCDAVPLMPTLVEDYKHNPASPLVTVRCLPWHYRDKALLIGDAAHAMVPFFGQGMNCAFEDCSVLNECIDQCGSDWDRIFASFTEMRKPNADAIADMALENFIEMRDKTASATFRFRKKTEHALHALFPQWFMPLYNMISFSNIPYAQAKARAEAQTRVLKLAGMGAAGLALLVIGAILFAALS